jgi:hypothetical protein
MMPQLHCYVAEDVAEVIRRRARERGLSVSQYLAQLAEQDAAIGWPPGYFESVIGGWKGDPLVRPPQGEFEERGRL